MTPRHRGTRALAGLAVAAALTAALTGCGGSSDGVTVQDPGAPVTTSDTPAAPRTDLTVTVEDGSGTTTWRLTCSPDGGDHPDPAGACEALARNGADALPPTPADRACTMIYGGPQKATISGVWRGEKVESSVDRTNGCGISRWRALQPLLPDPGT